MNCPNCNYQNPDGSAFCRNCGSSLNAQSEATTVLNDSAPAQENPYVQNNTAGQQNYGQTQYQQYNAPYEAPQQYQPAPQPAYEDEHVSVGQWIGIWALNLIPCVGSLVFIIMMFVYAFGDTKKPSLKNYARAQLIIAAIILGLVLLIFIIAMIAGISIADAISQSSYRYSYYY